MPQPLVDAAVDAAAPSNIFVGQFYQIKWFVGIFVKK